MIEDEWVTKAVSVTVVRWVMGVSQVIEDDQVMGVGWERDELVQTEQVQHHTSVFHVCRSTVRNQSEKTPPNQENTTQCYLVSQSYLGSRSQPTPFSLVSKTSRVLFCVDIKYLSLSSNSLF